MSTEANKSIKIRLRYWNCRGRAQSFRYMLEEIVHAHPEVDYQVETEYLEKENETWPQRKFDDTIGGPFQSLPVLRWNDKETFTQTLTIGLSRTSDYLSTINFHFLLAQLLARKFHLYGKLTSSIVDEDFLHGYIDGVVSCAYTDVISGVLSCIWNEVDLVDERNPIHRITKKIPGDLKALNNLLAKSSTPFYYDQPEPTIADYFVFEAFTLSRDFALKFIPDKENRQALEKLEQSIKQRPVIANYFAKGSLYQRFTGSPTEDQYMAKLAETKQRL